MKRLATWFATCFGLGRFPIAPGTLTSAVATLCGVPLVQLGWKPLVVGILCVTALGVPACGTYARSNLIYDPPDCVLDEVAGQWLTLLPVAIWLHGGYWSAYIIAFLAFRLFDIWKPWPVWWVERLPGGAGIMADDIFAAGYGIVLVFGALSIGWA